jgi:hypothetical protein
MEGIRGCVNGTAGRLQTLVDKGKGGTAPTGYKKIQCHTEYDVK